MFYRQASNQYINEGSAFTVDDVQYPANWLNLSSPEDKSALGLEEVVDANSPADDRFCWVSETLTGATRTYTNTPKDLEPLKLSAIDKINNDVWQLLLPSDYVDSRKANDPDFVPPAQWLTWRASVRSVAKTATTAIKAVTTVEELIPLTQVNFPLDPAHQPIA